MRRRLSLAALCLAVAALLLLLQGCDPEPPTAPADLAGTGALFTALEGEGAVYVLNAQLRPLASAPSTEPPSMAWGHIQVKIRYDPPPDDTYPVAWQGRIFNPDEETLTSGGIFFGSIPPPDDGVPLAPENEVLQVIAGGVGIPPTSDAMVSLSGSLLTGRRGEDMIGHPRDYFAWVATSEGAIAGEFRPDDD
jgi:hypothetical protein